MFGRTPFSSKRLAQIITTLMWEGFQLPLTRMKVSHCATLSCRLHCTWRRWMGKEETLPWPVALRNAMIKLGPAFVKIGQILSVRTDLIPAELAEVLHTLQSDVPPVRSEQITTLIEQELNGGISEHFHSFNSQPLAAGSVAQVHQAMDVEGREVIIKIKRPDIDKIVKEDLKILVWLTDVLERRMPESRPYRPVAAAKELQTYTLRELDFKNEAQVATQVRELFSGWDNVRIPEVYFSTSNMIVMEYIRSTPLDNLEQIDRWGLDRFQLIRTGLDAVLAQIFDFGLFHADPHPGNLHVTPEGELVLLDFGIFGRLDEKLLKDCALLMWALVKGDVQLASYFLLRMASLEPNADIQSFRRRIEERYQKWQGSSISEYGFARLIYDEFSLGARYGVIFPPNIVLLGKAMVTIEGVALAIDPDLDISKEARPYFNVLQKRLFSLKELRKALERAFPLWWELAEGLPVKLAETLERNLKYLPTSRNEYQVQTQSSPQIASSIYSATLILAGTAMLLYDFIPLASISVPGSLLFGLGGFLGLKTVNQI